ncbi:hypothetical protein I316_01758 [Kwoniella heveanensis BCC8398]|uniref:F-box domain-containing protein n=1 Tax=Kwoniella heveanensis BCC8398 TaxID=1296120 RepID=A0A1B9GZS5_9TREE|nr:hypothetical protein I316_01758 [Kwoniella heveanensis BCC8398]
MASGPSLGDIPAEVVLEFLLPALQLKDLVSLSAVNRQFNVLTNDSSLWRQKTLTDFNFPAASHPSSPSPGWWKRVYLGLLHPKAYVWGSSDNSRLGQADRGSDRRFSRFVDIPCEIRWDLNPGSDVRGGRTWVEHLTDSLASRTGGGGGGGGGGDGGSRRGTGQGAGAGEDDGGHVANGVVDLQAGGWSFTARTSDGAVWVWGQLDGTRPGFRVQSWEDKHCPCPEPTRIPLPCRSEAISAGRRHLLVLDTDNLIWEMSAWGKAYHHTAPELTAPSGHGTTRHPPQIIQLSAGWDHSAALSAEGDIHVWYPFSEAYEAGLTADDALNGPLGGVSREDGEMDDKRAVRWGTVGNDVVQTLPLVPSRPTYDEDDSLDMTLPAGVKSKQDLSAEWSEYQSTRSQKAIEEGERVVKIASGEDFVVALKKNGEVWLTRVKQAAPPLWQYLPYFSSPNITHITAQFRSLTTYATPTPTSSLASASASPSSSTDTRVNHARLPDYSSTFADTLLPEALPSLQGRGVIQVAIGDYHYAALTDKGEMLTWGQGNSGQLGRGADRSGSEPTKVSFSNSNRGQTVAELEEGRHDDGFVFAITAGGWHTGALVLGNPKGIVEEPSEQPRQDQHPPLQRHTPSGINVGYLHNDTQTGSSSASPMPGTFPVQSPSASPALGGRNANESSSGIFGNHTGHGVRAMPFFRVGFAGRGASVSGGRGGSSSHPAQNQDAGQEGTHVVQGGLGRGVPVFRVGFAGRGGSRGGAAAAAGAAASPADRHGGTQHGTNEGNGVGFSENGPH